MKRFRSLLVAVVIGTAATGCVRAVLAAGNADAFLEQVEVGFEVWDTNRDGELSLHEIELAVASPTVKGKLAAAAATLRRAIRSDHDLKWLTFEQVVDAVEHKPHALKFRDLTKIYESNCELIRTTRRELFLSDRPHAEHLKQGHLGDCFTMASLGTIAANEPLRLMKMFRPLPYDKYEVTFGNGRRLVLDMPTDAEICIGSTTGNDGVWSIAYEKAVGTIYLERQKTRKYVTPLSIVAVGGTPGSVLELVTGHVVEKVSCSDFHNGPMSHHAHEQKLAVIRKHLNECMATKRLMVGGNAPLHKQAHVPGLVYNHSYGVLGYDKQTDTVTFWNPLGNHFTPDGPSGLKHGYPTEHGIFEAPLSEAVMWFGSFSVETNVRSHRFD